MDENNIEGGGTGGAGGGSIEYGGGGGSVDDYGGSSADDNGLAVYNGGSVIYHDEQENDTIGILTKNRIDDNNNNDPDDISLDGADLNTTPLPIIDEKSNTTTTTMKMKKKQSILSKEFWKKNYKKILVLFLIINLGFPLYLSYNMPTSLVKIIGGILVDLFGPNKCSIAFMGLMTISTILAGISTITPTPSFGLIVFSRVLLGIGGESCLVCISALLSTWFKSDEMPFVMGIESTWVQFASLLAFGMLPSLYEATNFPFTVWFCSLVTILGLFLNIIFLVFQKRLDFRNKYGELKDEDELESKDKNGNRIRWKDIELSEVDLISSQDNASNDTINSTTKQSSIRKIFSELKKALSLVRMITLRMWLLFFITFFGYSAFYGFDIIVIDMIVEKYKYGDTKAAMMMAIETFFTGSMGPVFGFFVKKFEKRLTAQAVGITVMGIGLAIMTITTTTPLPWVLITGLGYGLMNNSIMSSVPVVVDEQVVGTAYGLIGTSYNLGIILYPILLGATRQSTGNYTLAMWILVLSSVLALVFVGILKYFDKKELNVNKRLDSK
ncbi:hypothetical protein DFA_08764 [Cavenderia fasciculata]|uniref:Lysosomal dipeptide transporter MFSD1 n=1 Tax=Cavenderia fasciculata TaxID=261658 RepID=F4Q463_CACFS|nr:uncharacterized protein DFA_08764 [Cavenderia fasciculata]EGG17765.1 hypothetical protein DFA_08764 [Cavenderia fasciculata]|eukprot:XP_004356249.1 hypothetical protein DFA_08764 [Cavenderia fasciculata]